MRHQCHLLRDSYDMNSSEAWEPTPQNKIDSWSNSRNAGGGLSQRLGSASHDLSRAKTDFGAILGATLKFVAHTGVRPAIQEQTYPNLYLLAGDDCRLTYSNRAVHIQVVWSSLNIEELHVSPNSWSVLMQIGVTIATQIKVKLIPPEYFVTFAFVLI